MRQLLLGMLFCALMQPAFAQEKPIITVLDFSTEEVSRSEMRTLVNLLSSALFQTRKYTVIDVNERERLLKEMEFSISECSDESCLIEVGKLLSAEAIVVGNIGKVGSRYILSTKMLETASSRTLSTADGIYETLDAMVDDVFQLANKLSIGTHAAAEPEVAATKPAKPGRAPARAATGNYLSFSSGLGLNIPLGAVAPVLGLGFPALLALDYNLDRGRWALSFGVVSGFQYQGTDADVRYGYRLLTAPLGVQLSYRLKSFLPFSISGGLIGGAVFNYVLYRETYEFRENQFNLSLFATPALGLGYQVSPRLTAELTARLLLIFFDQTLYLGLIPVIGIELKL